MLKRSLLLSPLVVGCYSYTPIEPAAVPVGTEVRAHISGAASDRIAPLIGQFNQRVLSGKLDEKNGNEMTLDVQTGAAPNTGNTIVPLVQRVPLTRDEVTQLETRQLSPLRTALLVGVVGLGTGLAAYAALQSGGGGSGESGGGGPPPINRIPLIKFHF
jgi:hypothetical protein